MLELIIDETTANKRTDIALSSALPFSRSMIQKLIHAGHIKCNEELVTKANFVTQAGQHFTIIEPESNIEHIEPEEGELEILFEDEHIIVVNKPADIIVHPGAGNPKGTLVNFLAHYSKLSDIGGLERLGVVHRLDKGVSGCIIFAKTNEAHINISKQFQDRLVQKTYIAICYGSYYGKNFNLSTQGIMEDYIGRSMIDRKKMATVEKDNIIGIMNKPEDDQPGKHAVMEYKILNCKYFNEKFGFISEIQCMPKTGRMHQIRVQLASRKLPIIGDTTYGNKQAAELIALLGNRIALHSHVIAFTHPIHGNLIEITAPIPDEFTKLMQYLETKN